MTLPLAANAYFKINGSQVTGFEHQDNRTLRKPGRLTSARVQYLPGQRNPIVIKGRARRGVLVPTGWLRAASVQALWTLVGQHETFIDETLICSVSFHGTTYNPVVPLDFQVLDPQPTTFSDEDTVLGARIRCYFLFQTLQA